MLNQVHLSVFFINAIGSAQRFDEESLLMHLPDGLKCVFSFWKRWSPWRKQVTPFLKRDNLKLNQQSFYFSLLVPFWRAGVPCILLVWMHFSISRWSTLPLLIPNLQSIICSVLKHTNRFSLYHIKRDITYLAPVIWYPVCTLRYVVPTKQRKISNMWNSLHFTTLNNVHTKYFFTIVLT